MEGDSGIRLLTMTGSAAGLIPRVSVNSLVYPIGQIVSASVGEYGAVLTDEQAECPLLVVAEGYLPTLLTECMAMREAKGPTGRIDSNEGRKATGYDFIWTRIRRKLYPV